MAEGDFFEELDKLTRPVASPQPAPVPSGAGADEFMSALEAKTRGPVQPATAPTEEQDPFFQALEQKAPSGVTPKSEVGYGELFSGAVQRGVQTFKAAPSAWKGILADLQGDQELASYYMKQADEIEKQAPEGQWKLENVSNSDDFMRWFVEKFGENSINLLAAIPTGGVGGLIGGLATKSLASRGVIEAVMQSGKIVPTAKAMKWGQTIGAGGALYPLTVGLETPQTAGEQFQVTGSPQADISLKAGLAKGLLEMWTPMHISKALINPGFQMGKTLAGAAGKSFLREGFTEGAQEAIDIYARQLSDSNYSYFTSGPTGWKMGEGAWRLAEATLAGGLIGAPFGVAGGIAERSAERARGFDRSLGDEAPGTQTTFRAPEVPQEARAPEILPRTEGPVTTLRKMVLPPEGGVTQEVTAGDPRADFPDFLAALRLAYSERRWYKGGAKEMPAELADPDQRDAVYQIWKGNGNDLQAAVKTYLGNPKIYLSAPKTEQPKEPRSFLEAWSKGNITQEVVSRDPRDDALGVGPLISTALPKARGEAALDWLDANTERYVEVSAPFQRTELDPTTLQPGEASYENAKEFFQFDSRIKNMKDSGFYKHPIIAIREPDGRMTIIEGHHRAELARREGRKVNAAVFDRAEYQRIAKENVAMGPTILQHNVLKAFGFEQEAARIEERFGKAPEIFKVGNRLWTDTELELEFATNRPQAEKPRLMKVNLGSLQPAAITAQLHDLPPVDSGRVHFIGDVPAQNQLELLELYGQLQQQAAGNKNDLLVGSNDLRRSTQQRLQEAYDTLLTAGLRVVPSRGSGFHYNGVIDGEPVEAPTTSSRSKRVGWYDPRTREISPLRMELEQGLTIGFPVSVDLNKLQAGDYIEGPRKTLILKKPLDISKLTPGVTIQLPGEINTFVPSFMEQGSVVVMGVQPEYQADARRIQLAVKDVQSAINTILKTLGIDGQIGFLITDNPPRDAAGLRYTTPMWVQLDQGVIGIVPSNMDNLGWLAPGIMEFHLLNSIMHEVGHQVTYWYYKNLPIEVQEALLFGWEKAKLAFRTGDQTRTIPPGVDPKDSESGGAYWTSFPEWLAEQFRRWATSDQQAKTQIDRAFSTGARKLEQYYKGWEQRFGKRAAQNLAEPDYGFSQTMDYIRTYSYEKADYNQLMKREGLYEVDPKLVDSPAKFQILKQVDLAIRSMSDIAAPDVQLRIKDVLDQKLVAGQKPTEGAAGRWIPDLSLIELAVGALKPEDAYATSRMWYAHETWHAYESSGIISKQEINLLMASLRGQEATLFPEGQRQLLFRRVKEFGEARRWTKEQIRAEYERLRDAEYRAYYLQSFANGDIAVSEEVRSIYTFFQTLMERIKNFLNGLGFQTREDVLRAFFKGEMIHRFEERAREQEGVRGFADVTQEVINQSQKDRMKVDRLYETEPGVYVAVGVYPKDWSFYFMEGPPGVQNPNVRDLGEIIGQAWITQRGFGRFEISNLESGSKSPTFASQMLVAASKDLGLSVNEMIKQLQPPRTATAAGKVVYSRMARGTEWKGFFDYYVSLDGDSFFHPNHVRKMLLFWKNEERRAKDGNPRYPESTIKLNVEKFSKLHAKVPKEAWGDPRTKGVTQEVTREFNRDGVQGSMIRRGVAEDEAQLLQALGHGTAGAPIYQQTFELKQMLSQAQNARDSGLSFELSAPDDRITQEVRNIIDEQITGYSETPQEKKYLKNLKHEMLRIGAFSKRFFGFQQILWRNEGNTDLIGAFDYQQHAEMMNRIGLEWLNRADETAREWEQVTDPKEREAIAETLFALSEMEYLLPAERAAKIVRNPSNWTIDAYGVPGFLQGITPGRGTELDRLFTKHKLKSKHQALIRRVQNDFLAFLKAVQDVRSGILQRRYAANPTELATKLAELTKEMDELRQKPYFPMMRFGEFLITVRDPNDNNKVVWSSAYTNQRQRAAALEAVANAHPGMDITYGRVERSNLEFMSMPGPLLKMIKEQLLSRTDTAGIPRSPEQLALIDEQVKMIEEFEQLQSPDRTFRKRWMPSKGTPGFSYDAFRAYAHYFTFGSRYLARLSMMDLLQQDIAKVEAKISSGAHGNTAKLRTIVTYMRNHYAYIMESGRDEGKFRAFFSLFFLGFSPAAAFINTTQILTTLMPFLAGHFGPKGYSVLNGTLTALKQSKVKYKPTGSNYDNARLEMAAQGRIDIGQAAEIAGFAEGANLTKLMASSTAQKTWRNVTWYGMWMFSKVERFNRELSFIAAWELAMKHSGSMKKDAKGLTRLDHIDVNYPLEIADLIARVGLTHQEALAFMFAKETIDRTQFNYMRYSDAPFLRGPVTKNILLFFKYPQSMIYAIGFNGAMAQMLIIMAFLYGLKGLPGEEEAAEALRLLAKWMFGKDFDINEKARTYVRRVTRDTIFDEVGPDLFMHGVSRYGFGSGLLPQGWGAPRFDASANGSMGRLIPGLAELLHGMALETKSKDIIADSAQRAAGAGYGTIFSLLAFLQESPGTVDSKKWEQLMPRFTRAWIKAYRYGINPQAETTQSGAKIVNFDIRDPDDLTTVLAQAFGFSPTKVTEKWELMREEREQKQIYDARKAALYGQMAKAIANPESGAVDDVIKAARAYNEAVAPVDPTMVIKERALISSLKQRQRATTMQERFGVPTKAEIPIMERLRDLYPGVRVEKVK